MCAMRAVNSSGSEEASRAGALTGTGGAGAPDSESLGAGVCRSVETEAHVSIAGSGRSHQNAFSGTRSRLSRLDGGACLKRRTRRARVGSSAIAAAAVGT